MLKQTHVRSVPDSLVVILTNMIVEHHFGGFEVSVLNLFQRYKDSRGTPNSSHKGKRSSAE